LVLKADGRQTKAPAFGVLHRLLAGFDGQKVFFHCQQQPLAAIYYCIGIANGPINQSEVRQVQDGVGAVGYDGAIRTTRPTRWAHPTYFKTYTACSIVSWVALSKYKRVAAGC
jgi:hypothetical protein